MREPHEWCSVSSFSHQEVTMVNEFFDVKAAEGSKSDNKDTSSSPFTDYLFGPAIKTVINSAKTAANALPPNTAEALVYPLAAEHAIKKVGGPDITTTRREHRKENPKTALVEGMVSPHLVTGDAMFRKYILGK